MAGAPLLLGIDAGTTRIRALVFEPDGTLVAEAARPTPTTYPRPGWAEHDPEALWRAACGAIRAALDRLERPERVRGVAAASVGEAFFALDRDGNPTAPVIAWFDERPQAELDRLTASLGAEHLHRVTGLAPDPTFTLAKLLWLEAHAPEALARTVRWLNVAHYLAFRLSGVAACDLSLASRTLALDLQRRVWASELIEAAGIDPALFAPLRPAGSALGTVTAAAAVATGLPRDCTVALGGHDHLVGALAVGALAPGVLLDSMGTAEALTLTLEGPSADPELGRQGYSQGVLEVERPVHYVFGGFPTSGGCVEWFRALFAAEISHQRLIEEARAVPPGAHGALFVPDLRGRLSPEPDARARGAFLGLTSDASRAVLFRALLEGLAFEARLTVDALVARPGLAAIDKVLAIGGNTRNPLLLQIKASVYRRPILATETAEATALGAAILGGLAAGIYDSEGQALAGLRTSWHEVTPVESWTGRYDRLHRDAYRPAFATLKPLHEAARAAASD